jgi:hypothetical protein
MKKFGLLISLIVLTSMLLLPLACNSDTPNPTTTGEDTPSIPTVPSPQELESLDYYAPELPRFTCEQVKQMLDDGEDFVLVDARLDQNYTTAHLPGAINIQEVQRGGITQSWIDNRLKALPEDKLIVFYSD